VYTTRTADASGPVRALQPDHELREVIDQVCRSVVDTWTSTASEVDRASLLSGRPYIPRELHRALLVDLSGRLGIYDIDEGTRYLLRDHFWEVVASARPKGQGPQRREA
jgi:hypothetical protein